MWVFCVGLNLKVSMLAIVMLLYRWFQKVQTNNVKRFHVSLRGHEQMFLVQLLLRRLGNRQIIKWL